MTIESMAALSPDALQSARLTQAAGVNFSLHDVARFENVMSAQSSSAVAPGTQAPAGGPNSSESFLNSPGVRAMFDPLQRINSSTEEMLLKSEKLLSPDAGPGEMVMAMMSAQKFMFESQLTASVANRTSDGVQELFRQQA